MREANPPNTYQPQMDGLRALAVMAVLLHHFDGPFNNLFNFGTLGVRFFFVMSGYLITRILLKARSKYENSGSSWHYEWKQFQMRRLIRTLPVYYFSIGLAVLIGIPPVSETLVWTMGFLTNFYMMHLGYFPDSISHFWSLAVQEQFYLFWPFIIFFLPRKWIKFSFPVLILVSLGFRLYCIHSGASEIVRWFSLPGSFDCFAMGGILAQVSLTHPKLVSNRKTRLWTGSLAFLAVFLASRLRYLPLDNPLTIWIEFLEAAAMGWLVACSVAGFRGWLGRTLSWRPLTFVGQISYGIYVYHVLVAVVLQPLFSGDRFQAFGAFSHNLRFLVLMVVTIFVASLSWHYFEKPMMRIRERIVGWFVPGSLALAGKS